MHRAFVHLELNTDDVDRARDFYRDVLGWKFNSVDVGDSKYVQIATPKPPGGGIQVKPKRTMSNHWMPYVLVEDVLSTVTRARKAGGEVVVDRTVMPGFGVLAIMTDPTGATFAVWEKVEAGATASTAPKTTASTEEDDARKEAARQRAAERKQAYAERKAELKAQRAAAKEARRQAKEERRAAAAEAKAAKERAQREAEADAKKQAIAEKKAAASAKSSKKPAPAKSSKKSVPPTKSSKKPAPPTKSSKKPAPPKPKAKGKRK